MASAAYLKAATVSKAEMLGNAYLMSTHDQFFLYKLQIMQDRLFLIETGSDEPKSMAYNLNTMFVVTYDTF